MKTLVLFCMAIVCGAGARICWMMADDLVNTLGRCCGWVARQFRRKTR